MREHAPTIVVLVFFALTMLWAVNPPPDDRDRRRRRRRGLLNFWRKR